MLQKWLWSWSASTVPFEKAEAIKDRNLFACTITCKQSTWAAKRQKKGRTKQTTSSVIACEARAGQRWERGQKAPFGHMWPVLGFVHSAGARDGCVTAGQAGCMSCSKMPGGGKLRKGVGLMGWEGGDWRREGVPAVMGLAFACEAWTLIYRDGPLPVFSSLLILLTCSLIIVPNRQKRRGWLANYSRDGHCIVPH